MWLAVGGVLERASAETLRSTYSLPEFSDTTEFLAMVALLRGRLGKVTFHAFGLYVSFLLVRCQGGRPDIEAAARSVLHDWNSGHIPYHTEPPTVHSSSVPRSSVMQADNVPADASMMDGEEGLMRTGDDVGAATLMDGFSKAFDIAGLWELVDRDVMEDGPGDVDIDAETDIADAP